jgi:hypothetical protein
MTGPATEVFEGEVDLEALVEALVEPSAESMVDSSAGALAAQGAIHA